MLSVEVADNTEPAGVMGRRVFLTRGALMAAAVALAACSPVGLGGPTGPSSLSLSLKLSDYASLATVGGVALLTTSGLPIAIVRTGQSSFVTLSRICPHQGTTIDSNGPGAGFTCPRHGARFSSTGSWQGGQPTNSLRAYTTNFDATTGIITVG